MVVMYANARVAGPYVGQPYNCVSVPFSGCEDLEIVLPTQIAYNENIMYQGRIEQDEV
jgi:hypothetical protein